MNTILDIAPAAFPNPWAARSFAVVNAAVEKGLFDLRDFQKSLIASIGSKEATGACIGDEAAYYDCWIEALTGLTQQRGVTAARLAQVEAAIRQRFSDRHPHTHAAPDAVHHEESHHEHSHFEHAHSHTHGLGGDEEHRSARAQPIPVYVDKAELKVAASPYPFPVLGAFNPRSAALVIIDMQRDFCDCDGYMGRRGADVSAAQALVPKIASLCAAARAVGMRVIYTREGHHPDLGDAPPSKLAKTRLAGAEIGSHGALGRLLVRGEVGWDIVEELTPLANETVIDKVGTGAFYATELEHRLRVQGVDQLVLVGVTTGVCVSTTAREASDRGFHVLVVSDCCAEPERRTHDIALELLQVEGGYIATVGSSTALLGAIEASINCEGDHK